jgi:hypothetical protein
MEIDLWSREKKNTYRSVAMILSNHVYTSRCVVKTYKEAGSKKNLMTMLSEMLVTQYSWMQGMTIKMGLK